jgi:hypothetical protein
VTLYAVVEPGAEVSLVRMHGADAATTAEQQVIRQGVADTAGLAVLQGIYMTEGNNTFTAWVRDPAGNQARSETPLVLAYDPRGATPPVQLRAIELEQVGEDIAIRAEGTAEQGDPAGREQTSPGQGVRRVQVKVRSETERDGFWMELVEDTPGSGRFRGRLKLAEASDPGLALLQVSRHGEQVEVFVPNGPGASLGVRDVTPPGLPRITSETHPAWFPQHRTLRRGSEGFGMEASRVLVDHPVDLREFPVLSFRYRSEPGTSLHLLVHVNDTWHGFTLTGEAFGVSASFGRERVRPSGSFILTNDGQWHQAHMNLYEQVRRHTTKSSTYVARAAVLGAWRHTGYNELSALFSDEAGPGYEIEQITFRKAAGGSRVRLAWADPPDLSGIVDYSYVLDQSADTLPSPDGRGKVNEAVLDAPDAQGTAYFHLRAKDGAGNWGAAAHFPFTADRLGPVASAPSPPPASRAGQLEIALRISDGEKGSGVDPDTIRLQVDGVAYGIANPALTYDPTTERLTFWPWRAEPPLPGWTDGKQVAVELAAATDFAGNLLQQPFRWQFFVQSSALGASDARMLTQEGGIEPAWAPDSRSLAYIVEGEQRSLWVLNVETEERRPLPVQLEGVATPAWSPDGSTIAVSAVGSGGQRDIFVIDVATGAVRNVTQGTGNNLEPTWLPMGEALLVVRNGDLWHMAPDGSAARVLFDDPDGAQVRRPQVASDGKSVLFWRSLYDEAVWLLDLVTGKARAITSGGHEVDPGWGPGRDEIVHALTGGSSRLIGNSMTGGATRLIVHNAVWWDRYPRVSPDGRRLAYQSTRNGFWNIWVVEWLTLGEFNVDPVHFTYRDPTPVGTTSPPETLPPPEPGKPSVRIAYDARGFARAELQVLDATGRGVVAHPLESAQLQSPGSLEWSGFTPSGEPLAAGPYLIQLVAYPPGGGEPLHRGQTVVFSSPPPPEPMRVSWWIIIAVAILLAGAFGWSIARLRRQSR